MKIGILTLPLETNYGGILQAFALQKVLRDQGHYVITIDRHGRREYPSPLIHVAGYAKRLLFHFLLHKDVSIRWDPFESYEQYKIRSRKTQSFIDRNILLTRYVYPEQLVEIDREYGFDAYVVGSDQVWWSHYCPNSFLDFVTRPDVIKVVYAASCSKHPFFNNVRLLNKCSRLAKGFAGISVREDYLVKRCSNKMQIDAQWVLDPTMLLSPSDYLSVTGCETDNEHVLFSYILDETVNKRRMVNTISKSLSIPYVNGNFSCDSTDGPEYPSVEDWIKNINRSDFVITDSFHGTVFAILFNKPFISLVNASRGKKRFESLLRCFHLENRLISETDYNKIEELVNLPIDFNSVNSILIKKREKSMRFLLDCLKETGADNGI